MELDSVQRTWFNRFTLIIFGLSVIGVGLFAAVKIGYLYASVPIAVGSIALGAIFIGLPFVPLIAHPISFLLGLEQFSPPLNAKPEYNANIGENFIDAQLFKRAYEHALTMIKYYPQKTASYAIAYEAAVRGEFDDEAIGEIDRLSIKNLNHPIKRDIDFDSST